MLPGHGGGTCLWVSFSTWKICHSLSAHVSYHVKFVLSVPSGNRLEGLGGLWWSYLPPAVHVHVHFSTLFLYACCTVLCLSLGARTRTFVPEECCLTSMWSLSPATSCSFLQCYQQTLVESTACGYHCWRHTHGSFLLGSYIVVHLLPC